MGEKAHFGLRDIAIFGVAVVAFCSSLRLASAVDDSGRIDCRDKIVGFLDCVNRTISEKRSPDTKLQLMKTKVNECLQSNKCARLYIVETRLGSGGKSEDVSPTHSSHHHVVHRCMHDLREIALPRVEKCTAEIVPDAAVVRGVENKWKLIQQARNKTQIQRLCAHNGSASAASNCIDRLFTPNNRAREREEKRFKEFCSAARQCLIGMGVCRTQLDNGRKAMCDCHARLFEDFNNIKKSVPSCSNITSEMIKNAHTLHPPFMDDDCGPDPCDGSFQRLLARGKEGDGATDQESGGGEERKI